MGGRDPQAASGSAPAPTFQVFVMHDEAKAANTRAVFARHGIPVRVDMVGAIPDFGTLLQIDLPSLVIVGPIAAFLAAFAGAAGKDAYVRLKAFLQDVRKTRGDRVVLVSDGTDRFGIVLTDDLPDEALQALFGLDVREFANRGTSGWDRVEHRWQPGWAPTNREDVVGWFAVRMPDGRPTPWHLSAAPVTDPVRTLCGADVGTSPEYSETPFREMRFPPCWRCVEAAGPPRSS
jgi:hypothetical protein